MATSESLEQVGVVNGFVVKGRDLPFEGATVVAIGRKAVAFIVAGLDQGLRLGPLDDDLARGVVRHLCEVGHRLKAPAMVQLSWIADLRRRYALPIVEAPWWFADAGGLVALHEDRRSR